MDANVQEAIDDSYRLMAYLTRVSIEIDKDERGKFDDYTQAIASAQAAACQGRDLTAEELAKFWQAFITLSNLSSPATIESIRYYQTVYGSYFGNRAGLIPTA